MAGSLHTMPLIVLNMGGEMTYILNQRLQAQSVQDEKARKVLQDVVKAMYSPIFVDELFKPQNMYSTSSTKQIFEKLAHSSIMRLNKSSMDKLYDLMCMGFKYQIISCNCPQQYLQITLNHLETLKSLLHSSEACDLIQLAIDKCIALYTGLSGGEWVAIKQSLMRFFQGKRIKVSLFLQQSLQTVDGALVLKHQGELPFGTEMPGTIRFFEDKKVEAEAEFDTLVRQGCTEATDVLNPTLRLGLNMYSKDANSAASLAAQAKTANMSQAAALKALTGTPGDKSDKMGSMSTPEGRNPNGITASSAKAELTMLADLLGMGISSGMNSSSKADIAESKAFRINLFPDTDGFMKGDGGGSKGSDDEGSGGSNFIMIDIDGTADSKTFERYMQDLNLEEEGGRAKQGPDEEDDLLALMDSSCK